MDNTGRIAIMPGMSRTGHERAMATVSLKLPDSLASRLAEAARIRRTSKSAIIRDGLDACLPGDESPPGKGSALALADDLVGIFAGPADLSRNRKHIRNFGH